MSCRWGRRCGCRRGARMRWRWRSTIATGSSRGCRSGSASALVGASGWRPERRRFRPHITLARVRGSAGGAAGRPRLGGRGRSIGRALERSLPATPRLSFTPGAIVLYRSWLAPDGRQLRGAREQRPRVGRALSARGGRQPSPSQMRARRFAGGDFACLFARDQSRCRRRSRVLLLRIRLRSRPFRLRRGRRIARLLPLREGVGVAPSSHSGSEPSSQEKEPSLARTGRLPSSQWAGHGGLEGSCAVFLRVLASWRRASRGACPCARTAVQAWTPCLALAWAALEQAALCVWASVWAARAAPRRTRSATGRASRPGRGVGVGGGAWRVGGGELGDSVAYRRLGPWARVGRRPVDKGAGVAGQSQALWARPRRT